MASPPLVVVSRYVPEDIEVTPENGVPRLDDAAKFNDSLDDYNHPRYRRARILQELAATRNASCQFVQPDSPSVDLTPYQNVQSTRMLEFFYTAWDQWVALGADGQDSLFTMTGAGTETNDNEKDVAASTPPLVPGNIPLPRDPYQRPSRSVMGQIGYYCTDTCTPVFRQLQEELLWDVAVMQRAAAMATEEGTKVVYALTTHPGHHAAHDSFGGYCYLNHVAYAARYLQDSLPQPTTSSSVATTSATKTKVAILDVDYHCGNGTASIFYDDATVLVISIHCHPDHEYPFHSGFEDETGVADDENGQGTTMHLPLLPGTTWTNAYKAALESALTRVQSFGAKALIVSLGVDTHDSDPCAIRRAGFKLSGTDYAEMGQLIGSFCSDIPIVVVQEGGYKMDKVPSAVADLLSACVEAKGSK